MARTKSSAHNEHMMKFFWLLTEGELEEMREGSKQILERRKQKSRGKGFKENKVVFLSGSSKSDGTYLEVDNCKL